MTAVSYTYVHMIKYYFYLNTYLIEGHNSKGGMTTDWLIHLHLPNVLKTHSERFPVKVNLVTNNTRHIYIFVHTMQLATEITTHCSTTVPTY